MNCGSLFSRLTPFAFDAAKVIFVVLFCGCASVKPVPVKFSAFGAPLVQGRTSMEFIVNKDAKNRHVINGKKYDDYLIWIYMLDSGFKVDTSEIKLRRSATLISSLLIAASGAGILSVLGKTEIWVPLVSLTGFVSGLLWLDNISNRENWEVVEKNRSEFNLYISQLFE